MDYWELDWELMLLKIDVLGFDIQKPTCPGSHHHNQNQNQIAIAQSLPIVIRTYQIAAEIGVCHFAYSKNYYKLGECRTLWGERERAVTKSNQNSYSG